MAAALSFYAILSLAPFLVIGVTIAAAFVDSASVKNSIVSNVTESLGKGSAELVVTIIDHASKPSTSIPATIIAILFAIYAASGLFEQIANSIEDIWEIKRVGHPFRLFIFSRLKSVVIMMVFLILLLAWLAADSVLGYLVRTSGGNALWPLVSLLASSVFATFTFAVTYRSIPKGRSLWGDVWLGAVVSGVAFGVAKYLLSLYFSYSGVATAYGSAGALLVILLWIYYSAQIFFYGAEVTRVVALRRKPKRANYAVPNV